MDTYKLKATKSSLYTLISEHFKLPGIKTCHFKKYKNSYWLEWYGSQSTNTAFFSVSGGAARLSVDSETESAPGHLDTQRFSISIPLDELIARNLVKESNS